MTAEMESAVKSLGKRRVFSRTFLKEWVASEKKYAPPNEAMLPATVEKNNFELKGEIIITAAPVEATENADISAGRIILSRFSGKVCRYALKIKTINVAIAKRNEFTYSLDIR